MLPRGLSSWHHMLPHIPQVFHFLWLILCHSYMLLPHSLSCVFLCHRTGSCLCIQIGSHYHVCSCHRDLCGLLPIPVWLRCQVCSPEGRTGFGLVCHGHILICATVVLHEDQYILHLV